MAAKMFFLFKVRGAGAGARAAFEIYCWSRSRSRSRIISGRLQFPDKNIEYEVIERTENKRYFCRVYNEIAHISERNED